MESKGFFTVNDRLVQVIEEAPKLTKAEEEALVTETSKLSIGYVRDLCKHVARRSVTHLVHGVQHLLFWLLEKIYEKQQRDRTHFREKIATQLVSFLCYLQKQSGNNFNRNALMPHYLWLPIHKKIVPYLEKGKDFLFDDVEKELTELVQHVFSITTTEPTPTFQQAAYWEKLIATLKMAQFHADNNHLKCVYTLLCCNFNHSFFIHYVFKCYVQAIVLSENHETQWQQVFTHVNRIIPESGMALLQQEDDCKKVLLKLIEHELSSCRFSKEAENIVQTNLPYRYNLSVAQLAVLLRVQIETGMVQCENISELLRYYSGYPILSKKNDISFKSLSNKYYEPDRASIQILMEYNLRMHALLKRLLN